MDPIKCPVCGEINPADAEFCQNCRSRLEHLTGPLRGEDAPLQPGQIPTKKVTAELEPILPQWLREAREKARQSVKDEPADTSLSQPSGAPPAPAGPDLLAGLASQGGEEEADVPDWLASLTGATAKKKKAEPEDAQQVKWVELGGKEEPEESTSPSIGATQTPAPTPVENTAPSWMVPQEPLPEKDELAEWFAHTDRPTSPIPSKAPLPAQPAQPVEAAQAPTPTPTEDEEVWLKNLASQPFATPPAPGLQAAETSAAPGGPAEAGTAPLAPAELPDWLKNLQPQEPPAEPAASPGAPAASEPDWLQGLRAQPPAAPAQSVPTPPAAPEPDWLKDLQAQQPAPQPPAQSAAAPSPSKPDWLRKMQAQQPAPQPPAPPAAAPSPSQPDWMQGSAPAPSESAAPAEVPDWLKAFGQTPAGPPPAEPPPVTAASPFAAAQVPDWLKAAAPQAPPAVPSLNVPAEAPASKVPAFSAPEPPAATPAFTQAGAAEGDNVDAIFASLQVPDWLKAAEPKSAAQPSGPAGAPAAPGETGETIAPAELPSWVQAMRPVETALPTSPVSTPADTSMEAGGPLAGLPGVLPVGPGFGPTSKPKSYSAKLNATTEHQTQATLLEQILAAETAPIPMQSAPVVVSQRVLRWVIAALLFLLVGGFLLLGTSVFVPPSGSATDPTGAAILAVNGIPAGAPVLAVFDYEPSLSGEMEAVASPYLERLLVLRAPRLTILSTSPTGAALAEQLMSGLMTGPTAVSNYQPGRQYIDLGYLPGGLAGVYDFAQNPALAMPLTADGLPAAETPPLKGVTRLSDYAALIVITDSAESGRVWVEQAGPLRGRAPLIVISSAQAGPMLMPYVASGQINGLVNGLNDAAKVERANGQGGLAERYWDAYSVGSLVAALMILFGGLLNLAASLQARRAERQVG